MDLYIRPTLAVMEKSAAPEVSLPEDANAWPQEIMQELYKQVPFVADFDIDVQMDRVDAERGYGFGHVLLASKSDSAVGTPDAAMRAAGINKVRIPIIIKERKLQPFDVVVTEDSKMLPLTEQRLRQALFRPHPFDVTGKTPGDQSMIGQLYPPYRQNSGGFGAFGNGAVVDAGMGKIGAQVFKSAKQDIDFGHGLVLRKGEDLHMGDYDHEHDGVPMTMPDGRKFMFSPYKGEVTHVHGKNGMGKIGSSAQPQLNERIQTVLGLHNQPTKADGEKKVKDLKKSAEDKEAVSQEWLQGHLSRGLHPVQANRKRVEVFGKKMQEAAQRSDLRGNKAVRALRAKDTVMGGSANPAFKELDEAGRMGRKYHQAANAADAEHLRRTGRWIGEKEAAALVPNSNLVSQNTKSIKKLMKTGSVLKAISSSVSVTDCEKFASAVSDPGLREAYARNGYATVDSLQTIMAFEPQRVEKIAGALPHVIRPDVVQVKKAHRGYVVKTARHDMWSPHEYTADRGQIVKAFGEKVAFEADTTGSVTLAEGPEVATPESEAPKRALADRAGMYKVRTDKGDELVGYVFPNLVDLDGTQLPMALFTNGSVGTLQAEISGEPVAEAKNPPARPPQTGEEGVFTWTTPKGEVMATVPLTMLGCYTDPDGEKHHVETMEGVQMFVACQPNIQTATPTGDDTTLLPESCLWMPLGQMEDVVLEGGSDEGSKQASAQRSLASVTVRSDGSTFSFDGLALDKIAAEQKAFLHVDDALFLMGGLGVSMPHAVEKLAESATGSAPVQVRVGRFLKTAGDAMGEARAAAATTLSRFPSLRVDLFKEAAFIPDPMAVDTVLSLGFINPENLSTFVTYLPQMEQAQHRLCELLIASRLGLQTVEAGALEKAIKSLEGVLDGLKVIAFQKN